MECVRQTMNGAELSDMFKLPPTLLNRTVQVIILPAEDTTQEDVKTKKRQLGFLKDKVPELPDSFFDPLSEEDLQAWGL